RSLGFGRGRIIFRHILPNILGPIIVYTTLTIPGVMLLEAFLSFLGLGVQPPMSSWGVLIKDGAEKMEEFPWLLIFPGALFSLTLFSPIFDRELGLPLTTVMLISGAIPMAFLLRAVSGFGSSYYTQLAGVRILEALRLDYFKKLQVLPLSFLQARTSGDLVSRGLADT